jgi:hypothetical protein
MKMTSPKPKTLAQCQSQWVSQLQSAIRRDKQELAEVIMKQIAFIGRARKMGMK